MTRAVVRNFQSVEKADFLLAPFTVVVGASNSGKSAFLRAVKTLAHNTSTPSIVRVGHASAVVSLHSDDGPEVWLERGPSLSTYGVASGQDEQRYPKSGVSVPEDVREVLRLPEVEGESLNFAFQFDRPFLLDAPGTKVAKILGDLTNINVLYDAVREANRRKLDASSKLKVRRADERELAARLESFKYLAAEKRAIVSAEALLTAAQDVEARRNGLAALVEQTDLVGTRLDELKASCGASRLPDVSQAEVEAVAVVGLRGLLDEAEAWAVRVVEARRAAEALEEDIAAMRDRLDEALREAGVCPLCGAST